MGNILWLNGAFGSGKTQAAHEICRRLKGSFFFDPENAGFFLRNNEPVCMQKDNFQDEPLWRQINRTLLSEIAGQYDGWIIAPQTLISPEYYREILGSLRADGHRVCHVLLDLPETEIRRRLSLRHETKGWAVAQIPVCLSAFADPVFDNRISAASLSIPETAEQIAEIAGFSLSGRLSPLQQKLVQFRTLLGAVRR